jgi:hypothetical protein
MSTYIPPLASSEKLNIFFNETNEPEDFLVMFPVDTRTHSTNGNRFEKGSFIPFHIIDGRVSVLGDDHDDNAKHGVYYIKDATYKKFSDLTEGDIHHINKTCPGFRDLKSQGRILIEPDQIVSLIRFNLNNALQFSGAVFSATTPRYRH